jgi:epoxyqueuosine reductase
VTLDSAAVKAEAARLGFIACGVAALEPLPHATELDRWLRSGWGGNMRYIHRQAKKRKNPQLADPSATRAVVVLDNYYSGNDSPAGGPKIARYARGEDYHRVTLRRLNQLVDFLRLHGATTARPYVDTGPIAERELAQRAGLGWIGKNTMLIRPGTGSWFFIGEVLTDLPLEVDRPMEVDHCGSCTRCLDACPTNAFVQPRVLDATHCISYLTIEHKSDMPEEFGSKLAGWGFGCDICNEVCPWNERFAVPTRIAEFRQRETPHGAPADPFDSMDEAEFQRRFGDTALARAGLIRMRRNWKAAWRSLL